MLIKSIIKGAAIALAAATSSASAGDEFSTLDGVSAESLSSVEMAAVSGASHFPHDLSTAPPAAHAVGVPGQVHTPHPRGFQTGIPTAGTASRGVVTLVFAVHIGGRLHWCQIVPNVPCT